MLRILILLFIHCTAYALVDDDQLSIGKLADNIILSYRGIGQMMIATAFVMGIGLGVASIFKFKQHKDNPTQVPIGTPLVMLFLSAGLVFLPGFYHPLGETFFGTPDVEKLAGGVYGEGTKSMPGYVRYQ